MDQLTALALAARDGDRWALEQFIRESQADVWRLCRYLADVGTADDLAQETYARAIRSLPQFRSEGSARSWLLAIARRTCADGTRRAIRRRRIQDRLESSSPPTSHIDGAWAEIADLLHELTPERREAFVLTQLLGLPYEEAAAAVGCPIGTIRSRVARARRQLVEAIADDPADGLAEDA